MALDCDQLKAEFDKLSLAYTNALMGKTATSVKEGDDQVDYAAPALARLDAERRRLSDLSIQQCGVDLMGTFKQTRIASPSLAQSWRNC